MDKPYTEAELERELAKVKSELFLMKEEAHMATLMCCVEFRWDESCPTAYTTGKVIGYNPDFFMALPPETRLTVLVHELWHIAMLHVIRGAGKNAKFWNIACDIWINNMLKSRGYSFKETSPILDDNFDEELSVDEIYEAILINPPPSASKPLLVAMGGKYRSDTDMLPEPNEKGEGGISEDGTILPTPMEDIHEQVTMVQQALEASRMMNQAGKHSHVVIENTIKEFLKPIIKWEKYVGPFFKALNNVDFTWAKPNPRIRHTYLPSLNKGLPSLGHVAFIIDSSGSMTDQQLKRINSEARYIKKKFNPEKMTLLNFDTAIRMEVTLTHKDKFNKISVKGRGGTDLRCVREWIIANKPQAVVIFSDLFCDPMEPLDKKQIMPMLWVVFDNPSEKGPHGRTIHVHE